MHVKTKKKKNGKTEKPYHQEITNTNPGDAINNWELKTGELACALWKGERNGDITF